MVMLRRKKLHVGADCIRESLFLETFSRMQSAPTIDVSHE